MNNKIQQLISRVTDSPSSIFTKDDVLNLITDHFSPSEEAEMKTPTSFQIEALIDELERTLQYSFDSIDKNDLIDLSYASFEISNGNEIELEANSVSVDLDSLLDEATRDIGDAITTFFDGLSN